MDKNVEKLLEKQMKWQKITAILLAVLMCVLLFAGFRIIGAVKEMTEAVGQAEIFLEEATEKLDQLDVDGINKAFAEVDEFVNSLDGVVEKANDMVDTMDGVTEKMDAASKAFDPIIEALENLKNKFMF